MSRLSMIVRMIVVLNRTVVVDSYRRFDNLRPVARSLVSANRWLRGIKMYRFPWYLTLVSTNHASSNPGLCGSHRQSQSELYHVSRWY